MLLGQNHTPLHRLRMRKCLLLILDQTLQTDYLTFLNGFFGSQVRNMFKTFLIMSPWNKKLISYVIFYFCKHHHNSVSVLQIIDQPCDVTNCHHLTRGIAGPNFNFIPCFELKMYAQRANLCFSKSLKK